MWDIPTVPDTKHGTYQGRIQDSPQEEGVQTYGNTKFSEKLHKIEKISGRMRGEGGARCAPAG